MRTHRFRERGLADRVACPVEDRLLRRVDPGHRARVSLSAEIRIRASAFSASKRPIGGSWASCASVACSRKNSCRPGNSSRTMGQRPANDHRAIARLDQRPRLQLRPDQDRLPGLNLQAVIHQQVGPSGDRFVGQHPLHRGRLTVVTAPPLSLSRAARPAATQSLASSGHTLDGSTRSGEREIFFLTHLGGRFSIAQRIASLSPPGRRLPVLETDSCERSSSSIAAGSHSRSP